MTGISLETSELTVLVKSSVGLALEIHCSPPYLASIFVCVHLCVYTYVHTCTCLYAFIQSSVILFSICKAQEDSEM